jgi:GntR family transcriptional regulator
VSTERYAAELALLRELGGREHPLTSAFVTDHGVGWEDHRVEANYTKGVAGEGDAERLGIAPGTPVLRRHLIKYIGSEPVQLQTSVLPLRLVAGTPVADPARQPWPGGTVAELWSIGLTVTRVIEEARARMPTPDERRRLEMAAGPVLEVTRTFWAEDEIGAEGPAEVSVVVVPAARMTLRFETSLR